MTDGLKLRKLSFQKFSPNFAPVIIGYTKLVDQKVQIWIVYIHILFPDTSIDQFIEFFIVKLRPASCVFVFNLLKKFIIRLYSR